MWAGSPPNPASKKPVTPLATPRPTVSLTNKIGVWEKELKHDPDKDFLLHGIKNGFNICNIDSEPDPVEMENYESATNSTVRSKVEKQIQTELANGC